MENKYSFYRVFKYLRENFNLRKSFTNIRNTKTSEISLKASLALLVIGLSLYNFEAPFILDVLEKVGITVSQGILASAKLLQILGMVIGGLCLLLVAFTLLPNILVSIFYNQGAILGFLAGSATTATIYFALIHFKPSNFWALVVLFNGLYALAFTLSCIFEQGNLRQLYEKKFAIKEC